MNALNAPGRGFFGWADTKQGRMLASAVWTILLVGVTAALLPITFLTNDDASIMYTFAGYYTGEPYPIHGFVNLPLGYLTSLLYMLAPSVPWWPTLQMLCVSISVWVIFYTLWDIGAASRVSHPLMLLINTLLYVLVLSYAVARLSFTMTACLLGTAGVLRLFSVDSGREAGEPVTLYAMLESLALMIACFLFRNSTGFSLVCFWAAGVAYHALHMGVYRAKPERRRELRRIGIYALAGMAVFAALVFINSWTQKNMNPAGYAAFEEARGNYLDFPHVEYPDDPAFFQSIGWDLETWDLVANTCFIDPAVTAQNLNAVIAHKTGAESAGILSRLDTALSYGEKFFRGNGAAEYILAVPVITALGALYYFLRQKRRGPDFLILAGISLGGALLSLYLCFQERLILRAFQTIAVPTSILLVPLFLRIFSENRTVPARRWGKIAGAGLLALATVSIGWSLAKTGTWFASYQPAQQIADMRTAERYAMDHQENVYIVNPTFIYNNEAFKTYPGEKPINIIDWGDTGMYSGWKTRQLEVNGLDALTPEIFHRENVYLMGTESGKELMPLVNYLKKDAGASGIARIDGFGEGYAVYKVVY